MRPLLGLILLIATPAFAQDASASLALTCVGGGSANKATGATINAWNDNGDYGGATISGTRSVGFEDQVSLRIDGSEGQLRMPRSMLPPIHGGSDGWFKLKNIKVSDGVITASVAVSLINSPKLRLDRYTGAISLSGKSGDFSGRCQKFDPAKAQRAF